eukprot:CAMPEP_0196597670 /NCGR_PEP_ID=MMETSP1081-20130531/92445_1 /TAXON_ID=36882 /ORGANISM="Pyramimonas amylifera, Strain CCMP720" /LENGTH=258 /DNA_ID=CAMNT_0041923155 /DNA_START=108 /DNA_END=884 /DNA_ORIENTATION=+
MTTVPCNNKRHILLSVKVNESENSRPSEDNNENREARYIQKEDAKASNNKTSFSPDELTEEFFQIATATAAREEEARLRAEEMEREALERVATGDKLYKLGKLAYERGAYSNSVSALEEALTIVNPNSSDGGEAQLWLALALEACGRNDEVGPIYRKLERGHPSPVVRKKAQELRYIFEAPALKINENERVKIKTLDDMDSYGAYKPMIRQRSRKIKVELTMEERVLQNWTPPYVPNKYILVATIILTIGLAVYSASL